MPSAHARLSPSAAERWISCPASIRMEGLMKEQGVEDVESIYAREGTAAHALGELKARHRILEDMTLSEFNEQLAAWQKEFDDILSLEDVHFEDMDQYTDEYVELIEERMQLFPGSILLLEQRVPTGVPTCWGTSDTVIVSPKHVEIIDFKYGSGVYVSVFENPQLRLYGVGALDYIAEMLGDVETVRITVHQPRMNNIATEELHPDELRAWRDSIIPIAELAMGEEAPFGPSDTACHWCPASGRCEAQAWFVFEEDFEQNPDELSPERIAEIIPKISLIRSWLSKFEAAALTQAYAEGKKIPGYKVVMSGGKRSVVDPKGAETLLLKEGYTHDQIGKTGEFKMNGIGDLEKLLKKEKFKTLLEDTGLVRKGEGRPSIVPESDNRPDINPTSEAVKDFGEEES